MVESRDTFLAKALSSRAGAESEFAYGRYDNAANRCYYACFQAAVFALSRAGIRPTGRSGEWEHDFVQARFNGELIGRRKLYSSELLDVLRQTYAVRVKADYEPDQVTQTRAARTLRKAIEFVEAVRSEGGRRWEPYAIGITTA